MAAGMTIVTSTDGPRYRIVINRPEQRNALNEQVLQELENYLRALAADQRLFNQIRYVTIEGSGDKAFIAGADIKTMQRYSPDRVLAFIEHGQSVMRMIEDLPLPVIAVVHSHALGGGLELALACDLIVASENAKLGQPEVNLGLIPGFGGTQRMLRRLGPGSAKRMIFCGEAILAVEAKLIGLIDVVSSPEQLESEVLKLGTLLSTRAPLAISAAKRAIDYTFSKDRDELLGYEVSAFIQAFKTADAQEGMRAFIDRRSPTFSGN
jgi:enoyl-CoA hydratase